MATSEIPKVQTESRERVGSRYAKRLRDAGRLPGVIYGHQQEPTHVSLDRTEMTRHLINHAHLFELEVDGKTEHALVKDVQWDYLGAEIIHVDLTRVDMKEEVQVDVAINLVGEAVGLKEAGALLTRPLDTLNVTCRADRIPEVIVIDVSELEANDSMTVAQVAMPEGVTCNVDPETVVASITIQQEIPEEELAPAEGEEQPEVISEKKEDEGEEASAE